MATCSGGLCELLRDAERAAPIERFHASIGQAARAGIILASGDARNLERWRMAEDFFLRTLAPPRFRSPARQVFRKRGTPLRDCGSRTTSIRRSSPAFRGAGARARRAGACPARRTVRRAAARPARWRGRGRAPRAVVRRRKASPGSAPRGHRDARRQAAPRRADFSPHPADCRNPNAIFSATVRCGNSA